MALQYVGSHDPEAMITVVQDWALGTHLEQRAAIAAICEPFLLKNPATAQMALHTLKLVTTSFASTQDRKSEGFKGLRKGLAYCWSVAVAASPALGKPMIEAWLGSTDPDVRWVMRENLKKKRLLRVDADWVHAQAAALAEC